MTVGLGGFIIDFFLDYNKNLISPKKIKDYKCFKLKEKIRQ